MDIKYMELNRFYNFIYEVNVGRTCKFRRIFFLILVYSANISLLLLETNLRYHEYVLDNWKKNYISL